MTVRLAIVVPCYNEEEVLPETNKRLLALLTRLHELQLISIDSSVHYVDDGSKDSTWFLIESLAAIDTRVHGAYSGEPGQRFHRKLDTHSRRSWTVGA